MKTIIKNIVRKCLPSPFKEKLKEMHHDLVVCRPALGWFRFGDLRRITPISRMHGTDRVQSITRYYINKFLESYQEDVKGRVLEVGDNRYTKQFGKEKVTLSDVLHYTADNPQATFVGDLTKADHIPSDTFDCIIITQTLQMIYDVYAAVKHLYRILKPGGVLLATSHGISKIDRFLGIDPWGEYWRFTGQGSHLLFSEFFKSENVTVKSFGNVLSAISFLYGLAVEDLKKDEMDHHDPAYEVVIGVRAIK